jgi:hypothetical protein
MRPPPSSSVSTSGHTVYVFLKVWWQRVHKFLNSSMRVHIGMCLSSMLTYLHRQFQWHHPLFDPLFKQPRLHCSDVIFVTHKSMMTIPSPTVWTPPWYATIPDWLSVIEVPDLLKNWWWCIKNYPEPCTQVFSFTLLSGATFINHQIVQGLPPPPFFNPKFLKLWFLRHETALSVSA